LSSAAITIQLYNFIYHRNTLHIDSYGSIDRLNSQHKFFMLSIYAFSIIKFRPYLSE